MKGSEGRRIAPAGLSDKFSIDALRRARQILQDKEKADELERHRQQAQERPVRRIHSKRGVTKRLRAKKELRGTKIVRKNKTKRVKYLKAQKSRLERA